jgi:hypothetical protein
VAVVHHEKATPLKPLDGLTHIGDSATVGEWRVMVVQVVPRSADHRVAITVRATRTWADTDRSQSTTMTFAAATLSTQLPLALDRLDDRGVRLEAVMRETARAWVNDLLAKASIRL